VTFFGLVLPDSDVDSAGTGKFGGRAAVLIGGLILFGGM